MAQILMETVYRDHILAVLELLRIGNTPPVKKYLQIIIESWGVLRYVGEGGVLG